MRASIGDAGGGRWSRLPLWPLTVLGMTAALATAIVLGRPDYSTPRAAPAAIRLPPGIPAGTPVIRVSKSHCGDGWSRQHAGRQTFWLRNTGGQATDVQLVEPRTGRVYAEVDRLGRGGAAAMRVRLGRGEFAFRCKPDAVDPITGRSVRIGAGPSAGGPAVVQVQGSELIGPVRRYRHYVTEGLATLARKVEVLRAAVHSGDLAAARHAWLPAHLAYERLGAAYGAFGEYGQQIDGRPDGLAEGVHDAGFTGFHRVEYGLWHGATASSLRAPTDRLSADIGALRKDFPRQRISPLDLTRRAHEILEDTLRSELTGAADRGSGTSLATAHANLAGTRKVLSVLRPVVAPRYHHLSEVDGEIDRVNRLLLSHRRPDGSWTPLGELTHRQRERLNGSVGAALEDLASIAAICEPRRGGS